MRGRPWWAQPGDREEREGAEAGAGLEDRVILAGLWDCSSSGQRVGVQPTSVSSMTPG